MKLILGYFRELESQSDRGVAIIGTAMLARVLEDAIANRLVKSHLELAYHGETLRSRLFDQSNAPLGTLYSRIELAFALGILTEPDYRNLRLIRRIRNAFAHQLEMRAFSDSDIAALCNELSADPSRVDALPTEPRDRFQRVLHDCISRVFHEDLDRKLDRMGFGTRTDPEPSN